MNICHHCYPEFPLGGCQAERCNHAKDGKKGFITCLKEEHRDFSQSSKIGGILT